MNSYYFNAISRDTGKVIRILALDDYFGQRVYGYRLPSGDVLTYKEYTKQFERVQKEG